MAAVTHLRVDMPGSDFWLDLDIKRDATLLDLDAFLRSIWLECCDHLSEFEVGRIRYTVPRSERFFGFANERCMRTRVSASLPAPGEVFAYEYDFGSTTRLRLKVVAHHHAPSRREPIRLLAQNERPDWKCEECGDAAASLCASYSHEEFAFLCPVHAETHECDEEIMLPALNSPRVGVCGYGG